MITQAELKATLKYDPETGILTWGKNGKKIKQDAIAGSVTPNGYVVICINRKRYKAHRLAWLYMTGAFPEDGKRLDHINRNPSDNRWCNLRLATPSQNCHNAVHRKPKGSGITGVYPNSNNLRWTAKTTLNRKAITIGTFDTKAEAHEAYQKKVKEIRGEFVPTQDVKILEESKPALTSKNLEQQKTLFALFNVFKYRIPEQPMSKETLFCKDCGCDVSVSMFTENKASKTGYAFYCKEHAAARQNAWKKANREKVKLAKRAYYQKQKSIT